MSANRGSVGLDLASTETIVFDRPFEIKLVATGVYGPISLGMVGLVFGHSSSARGGIILVPGVIDSDYQGQIFVMTLIYEGLHVLQARQAFARLVLLPYFVPAAAE